MKALLAPGFLCLSLSSLAQISPTEAELRAAIAVGGKIQFNTSGVVSLTAPLLVTGDTIVDATGLGIMIDGQSLTRIFDVQSGVRLTLTNVVIVNGISKGADGTPSTAAQDGFGGAIRNNGGIVEAISCTFSNNAAIGGRAYTDPFQAPLFTLGGNAFGGAIWQNGGSTTLRGASFIANNSTAASWGCGPEAGLGGAIYAAGGTIVVDGTTFATNTATGGGTAGNNPGGNGEGGAIYAQDATVTVKGATFVKNGAVANANSYGIGGGISLQGGSALDMVDSYFLLNGVVGGAGESYHGAFAVNGYPGYGGAIYIGTNSTAKLRGSTFASNNSSGGRTLSNSGLSVNGSGFGGAVFADGSLTAANCTFANNEALRGDVIPFGFRPAPESDGAAIFSKGSVAVTNVTLVSNTATLGAMAAASGSFSIKNTLLGGNAAESTSGAFVDAGYNLSDKATIAFNQSSSQVNAALKLGPLGNYGGPTPTIPILAGSPAIDAADDAAAPPTDQRGRARPYGLHADIGAFESSAPFVVFGKVIGYRNGAINATHDTLTVPLDSDGNFNFTLSPGNNSFSFTAPADTVIRANPLTIDVQADTQLHATAFQFSALAFDPDIQAPTITFAGKTGETWEFQASGDLAHWTSVGTTTFNADGLYSIPLAGLGEPVFLKGIKH